jgi:hypothetical protein
MTKNDRMFCASASSKEGTFQSPENEGNFVKESTIRKVQCFAQGCVITDFRDLPHGEFYDEYIICVKYNNDFFANLRPFLNPFDPPP